MPGVRRTVGWIALALGATLLVAWLAGRVLSDRWTWSQWLLWMPTLTLAPAFVLTGSGLALLGVRRRAVAIVLVAAMLGPIGELIDLWRPGTLHAPAPGALRILHWSAGPTMTSTAALEQLIHQTDPHVVIVLGARQAAAGAALEDWGAVPGPLPRGEFMVFSTLPVLRCRSLARSRDIQLVALDLAWAPGAPFRMLLVDMPSDLTRNRWAVAAQARDLIDRTVNAPPDLVVGDFNMTQQSRALRSILPDWQVVWPDGGHGWGGTWPRSVPMWRIDHVLIPPGFALPSIQVIDPGTGRHRAQIIDVPWKEP
jgi:hypothetical protein